MPRGLEAKGGRLLHILLLRLGTLPARSSRWRLLPLTGWASAAIVPVKRFHFRDTGPLVDGDLELDLVSRRPADPVRRHVPGYQFEMRRIGTSLHLETINLRIGAARALCCPGQIGYQVGPSHRGHRDAARSCRLLLPLAQAHGLKVVWLTADPTNLASRRTCEIIGARYVETVRIPRDHEMYRQGARYRRRYRLPLPAVARR